MITLKDTQFLSICFEACKLNWNNLRSFRHVAWENTSGSPKEGSKVALGPSFHYLLLHSEDVEMRLAPPRSSS